MSLRRKSTGARNRGGLQGIRIAAAALALTIGITFSRPAAPEEGPYLTGRLLVATPEIGDPRFAQTIIYMLRHDESGAMGLVVNRPLAKGPIGDLLKALGAEEAEASGEIILHYGGPVDAGRAFVLHSSDYVDKATITVDDRLAMTADIEIVRAIGYRKGPRRSLFALGYAGWGPGQLEGEIKSGDWFSIPTEETLIFDGDPRKNWERAQAKRKIET